MLVPNFNFTKSMSFPKNYTTSTLKNLNEGSLRALAPEVQSVVSWWRLFALQSLEEQIWCHQNATRTTWRCCVSSISLWWPPTLEEVACTCWWRSKWAVETEEKEILFGIIASLFSQKIFLPCEALDKICNLILCMKAVFKDPTLWFR